MANIRDPSFWKRFSMAVHLDEEQHHNLAASHSSSPGRRPQLKHTPESWLERQRAKQSRRTCICWVFWIGFAGVTAAVVIVVLLLEAKGVFNGGSSSQQSSSSSSSS